MEELQRRLTAVEATLAEEREKAAQSQQALEEQQYAAEKHTEASEQATESASGQAIAFGLTPFVRLQGTDIFNVSQQMFQQALKQPQFMLKHPTNFLLEMGRVMVGQSTVEPDAKDKRFAGEICGKRIPFTASTCKPT